MDPIQVMNDMTVRYIWLSFFALILMLVVIGINVALIAEVRRLESYSRKLERIIRFKNLKMD